MSEAVLYLVSSVMQCVLIMQLSDTADIEGEEKEGIKKCVDVKVC